VEGLHARVTEFSASARTLWRKSTAT